MFNKKGLSAVVTTLIIILLVMVAIAIVWVVISNVISQGAEEVSLGKFTVDAEISNVNIDNSTNNVSLSVKRKVGEGEINGIKFIFYSDIDSESIEENISLEELETTSFNFHLNLDVNQIIRISIVPIFKTESGKEVIGNVVDEYDVGSGGSSGGSSGDTGGEQNETCTPTSNPCGSYECGTVQNGTCGNVSCGTCSGSESCVSGVCVEILGDVYYVRDGATGTNNGSDWTNAYTELPATLERNVTYYIADGSYGTYTFNDAESGTQYITVKKAISFDHGTSVGWSSTYGDGQALFNNGISFSREYYIIDGQEKYGLEVLGGFQGDVVDISADNIIMRYIDVNGNFNTNSSGYQNDGACTGIGTDHSFIRVENCLIHNIADDGVSMYNGRGNVFENNTMHTLFGCGTDNNCGPCYNGHSDGYELGQVNDTIFSGNLVYNISSTSAFLFEDFLTEPCRNVTFLNNIFYNPKTGFVMYIIKASNITLYNNVIWGTRKGSYGGLAIGEEVTDLEMYNNIILSINYAHMGETYDPVNHRGDYNLFGYSTGQYTEQANDIIAADPLFTGVNDIDGPDVGYVDISYFSLQSGSPAIDQGTDLGSDYNYDILGISRPQNSVWDIGAYEFT